MTTDQLPGVAEQITDLLAQLYDGIETRDTVPTYRRVNRGKRDALLLEFAVHRTTAPGLLTQLGVISAHGGRPGTVIPGAALPGGSPGWDADGALSPMVAGGKPDSAEPVTEAWHVGQQIRADLTELVQELRKAGHQGGLIDIALADEETGRLIAARLRSLVSRARVAADYDAPIVPLRDVYCPECGGPMRVRADASSGVWCIGTIPLAGPARPEDPEVWPIGAVACGARWPRGSWVKLLEQTAPYEREAAAGHV